MYKIEIKNIIENNIACIANEAKTIGEDIVNMNYKEIIIDFNDIEHITSVFLRNLLIPLYDKKIDYKLINLSDKMNKVVGRLINEFNLVGTVNLRTMENLY